MACNCIETIMENFRRDVDPEAEFGVLFFLTEGELTAKPGRFSLKYRKKKSDGKFEKKKTKSFMAFIFCPFCGTRYDEESESP